MSDRTPRDVVTRTTMERKTAWTPPSLLPVPRQVEGTSYRWIRKMMQGQVDDRNMMSKQEEGWIPIKREDPRMPLFSERKSSTSRGRGN